MINVTTLILKLSISHFLDGDIPCAASYGVYISQLIRFARASSYITDFNTRNELLTEKLLKQGYWYNELCKSFSLLRQGNLKPEFYGGLVYKLKKMVGFNNFQRSSLK